MKIDIITYNLNAADIGSRLLMKFNELGYKVSGYLFDNYEKEGFIPFHETKYILEEAFKEKRGVVFVSATGIAVRTIAPFVTSKFTDSPVVVMDDMANYAISLLSGHAGGANELAELCAKITGATPVITTSTDIHEAYAVDMFAKRNDLVCTDPEMTKGISAAILDGKKVGISFDREWCEIVGDIPAELYCYGEGIRDGIVVTPFVPEQKYENTLYLYPKQLTVGIGCRKGIKENEILEAVKTVFEEERLCFDAIKEICSIDLKKDEKGLVDFCNTYSFPFKTYTSDELKNVTVKCTPSAFVEKVTGVNNVCEKSTLLEGDKTLIVRKHIVGKVTVAVAIEKKQLNFVI